MEKQKTKKRSRKADIVVWKIIENVECISNTSSWTSNGFTIGKTYTVFGMAFDKFPDRSQQLCYLVEDDKDRLRLATIRDFKLVKN